MTTKARGRQAEAQAFCEARLERTGQWPSEGDLCRLMNCSRATAQRMLRRARLSAANGGPGGGGRRDRAVEAALERLRVRGLHDEVAAACLRHGVTIEEVLDVGRMSSAVAARHECWRMLRDHPERHFSWPDLGWLFNRDHTTVMAGVKAARRRRLRIEVAA